MERKEKLQIDLRVRAKLMKMEEPQNSFRRHSETDKEPQKIGNLLVFTSADLIPERTLPHIFYSLSIFFLRAIFYLCPGKRNRSLSKQMGHFENATLICNSRKSKQFYRFPSNRWGPTRLAVFACH